MLRQLTPDLIIAAGSGECIDLLLAGPLEVPVVAMFHLFPPACFAQTKLRRAARLKALLPQVAECQVLLPSHRDTLRPYTSAPVTAIANGITYPVDEPLPPAASREKTILYVANFLPEKNHAELMEAFSRLNAPEWTLHLYGSGKPEAEASLKMLAQNLGIADRVRFTTPAVISRPILLQASICAFPSKMEGFGLALAEAMWCGLPCVGFKEARGVNELIVHEANGLLADPGPEAFAAQLQRLIDDAALREHLGAIAARTARRAWAQETIMQLWDDLIQRNLQRPRPTPTSSAEPNA
jgi:glycosyltransferase involved in cell wall biosynthesis